MAEKGKQKEKAPVSTTKLILHFDIRNTLVMCDLLKGTSKEDTVNPPKPISPKINSAYPSHTKIRLGSHRIRRKKKSRILETSH